MAGRKPKPTALKKLEGNPGKRKLNPKEPIPAKGIDDWLDQFEMFSIYEVLPEILALWGTNLITDIDSKKT